MATKVYETETLTIGDITVEMPPLKVYYLRKFMNEFERFTKAKSNDEAIGVIVDCCVIAFEQYNKDFAEAEKLEMELDLQEMYRVVKAASGIELGGDAEGNLQTAAVEASGQS